MQCIINHNHFISLLGLKQTHRDPDFFTSYSDFMVYLIVSCFFVAFCCFFVGCWLLSLGFLLVGCFLLLFMRLFTYLFWCNKMVCSSKSESFTAVAVWTRSTVSSLELHPFGANWGSDILMYQLMYFASLICVCLPMFFFFCFENDNSNRFMSTNKSFMLISVFVQNVNKPIT